MSAIDWRGLCEELVNALACHYPGHVDDDELINRARALLAQPGPEVREPTPSNQLVEQWVSEVWHEGTPVRVAQSDLHLAARAAEWGARWGRPAPAPDDRGVLPMIVSETGADDEPELERIICASISGGADYVNSMPRELRLERITPEGSTFARYIQVDADARPDVRPAPAPAGEVAKLVQPPGRAGLTWQGVIEGLRDVLNDESEDAIQRVWQRSRILDAISVMEANPCPAPVPVAVSERLPGAEERDSDECCWWFYPETDDTLPVWVLSYGNDAWEIEKPPSLTHWLPAHTLPLPSGEVG